MATVAAFQVSGLRLWFWSNDHEPPHFHAKRAGEWEATVRFMLDRSEMIKIVWARKRPPRKVLAELASLAAQHRLALLTEWEEIRRREGELE